MKKLLPFFLILECFGLLLGLSKFLHMHMAVSAAPAKQQQLFTIPTLLTIPKIHVVAHVVPVGLDTQHRMDIPNNFVDVGWYDLGYKLGQQGSVVIDGHYDDFHGNPAVFYKLDTLSVGDTMTVDGNGKAFTYIVAAIQIYPYDHLPLQRIFASTDTARVNLITCHGSYIPSIGTYNQRVVVYAILQK